MKAEELISDLINRTKDHLNRVQKFSTLSDEELNFKSTSKSWSILECLEHLNRYGAFYIPEIKQRIEQSSYKSEDFKSGWLGNYFSNMMLPREKLNKMKTFNYMNPVGSKLSREVIEVFSNQQKEILGLLDKARKVSLTKTKTSISITRLLKLRLGDTFRVVIYHNLRHVVQAEKVMTLAIKHQGEFS